MKYYHATAPENLGPILRDGKIKAGFDGVYLCLDPIDASKFLVIRGYRDLVVIEVELDEHEVFESFDHSEAFFKCKAYVYPGDITLKGNEVIKEYHFNV